jgi:putative membrane protein
MNAFTELLLAHAGEPDALQPLLSRWTMDPLVISLLVVTSLLYIQGVSRLWRRAGPARGVRWYEVLCFALGQASVVIALLSPLDAASDVLFSAHMGQHEILMLISAPLLVVGRPLFVFLWAFRPQQREAIGRFTQRPAIRSTWRAVTHPLVIVVAHGAVVWIWHLPLLFEAAIFSEPIHALQHASFFLTAALFWWTIIYGRYGRLGYGVAVLYVFITAAHTGALGALATFARAAWYPSYADPSRGLSAHALEDQQLAGLIMWVPAGAILTVVGLALFAAWMGQASRSVARGRMEAITARGSLEASSRGAR